MNAQPVSEKPNAVLFLGVKGVLIPNTDVLSLNCSAWGTTQRYVEVINQIARENFPDCQCNNLILCQAETHLFNKDAVHALEGLITKMQAIANVHIVLSSDWRRGFNVEEIKSIFSLYEFSKLIIDKTTDEDDEPYENWKDCCVKPHFDWQYLLLQQPHKTAHDKVLTEFDVDLLMSKCRASEIKQYLKSHPEYDYHMVIANVDSHLSYNFDQDFISTKNVTLFTKTHAARAYHIFNEKIKKVV